MNVQDEFENFEACMEGHETAYDFFEAGWKAARVQQEPVVWARLVSEAQAIVESKSVWKKFIDGTPLQNDISVWMADFAESHTNTAPAVALNEQLLKAAKAVLQHAVQIENKMAYTAQKAGEVMALYGALGDAIATAEAAKGGV